MNPSLASLASITMPNASPLPGSSSASASASASHPHRRVQIEVLDEHEFDEEERQQMQVEEERRRMARRKVHGDESSASSSNASNVATDAAAAASAAPSTSGSAVPSIPSSSSSSSPVPALLSQLILAPCFAQQYTNAGFYDDPKTASQRRIEIRAFHSTAEHTLKQLAKQVRSVTNDNDNANGSTTPYRTVRPFIASLVLALLRFQLDPSLLRVLRSDESHSDASEDEEEAVFVRGDDDTDVGVDLESGKDTDEPTTFICPTATTLEDLAPWTTIGLQQLSRQILCDLAHLHNNEATVDTRSNQNVVNASASSITSDDDTRALISNFLADILTDTLLPALRSELKGSTNSAAESSRPRLHDKMATTNSIPIPDVDDGISTPLTPVWMSYPSFPSGLIGLFLILALPSTCVASHLPHFLPMLLPLISSSHARTRRLALIALNTLIEQVARAGSLSHTAATQAAARAVTDLQAGWGEAIIKCLTPWLNLRSPSLVALAWPAYLHIHFIIYPAVSTASSIGDRTQHDSRPTGATAVAASASSISARLDAQSSLFSTVLSNLQYLALSPNAVNLSSALVYARRFVSLVVYFGPRVILPKLGSWLALLLHCTTHPTIHPEWRIEKQKEAGSSMKQGARSGKNRASMSLLHLRLQLASDCWMALLTMLNERVLSDRIATRHGAALLEAVAQAWILYQDDDEEEKEEAASVKKMQYASMDAKRNDARSVPPPTSASDVLSHIRIELVMMVRTLLALAPAVCEPVWKEITQIKQLARLKQRVEEMNTTMSNAKIR